MPVETELYERLKLSPNATQKEIKKAYRKMAIKWHPDKNQNNKEVAEAQFKKISEAYTILSDEEKKQVYDTQGYRAVNQEGGPGNSANDIFEMFFGGMSPFGGAMRQRRKENHIQEIRFTLKEMYDGCVKTLKITRKKQCLDCVGKGSKRVISCPSCKGRGVQVVVRQLGPGMIQQMQTSCRKCSGKGVYKDLSMICVHCNGIGKRCDAITITYKIKPGTEDGDHQIFVDKGNENENGDKSDLVLVAKQKGSSLYTRKKNDLVMEKKILLGDALTGAEWEHEHINGQKLYIHEKKVIKDDMISVVKNRGMPIKGGYKRYGDLIIIYKLTYPKKLQNKNNMKLQMTNCLKSLDSCEVKTSSYIEKKPERQSSGFNSFFFS